LLHHCQLLVAKHDLERREVGVGAQHEDAVEPGVLLGLGAIDTLLCFQEDPPIQ
jgi:hypothetical protein